MQNSGNLLPETGGLLQQAATATIRLYHISTTRIGTPSPRKSRRRAPERLRDHGAHTRPQRLPSKSAFLPIRSDPAVKSV